MTQKVIIKIVIELLIVINKERANNLVSEINTYRQKRKSNNKSSMNAKLPSFGNNFLYIEDKDIAESRDKNLYEYACKYKMKPNTSANQHKEHYFSNPRKKVIL